MYAALIYEVVFDLGSAESLILGLASLQAGHQTGD
jgi:hypothetical protein